MILNLAKLVLEVWDAPEGRIKAIAARDMEAYEQWQINQKTKLTDIENRLQDQRQKLATMEVDPENEKQVQERKDAEARIKRLEEEAQLIAASEKPNVDESVAQITAAQDIFTDEKIDDNKLMTFAFEPKWLRGFFKFGKLPAFLYNATVFGQVVFQPCVESLEDDSSRYATTLRARLYGFLGLKSVTEYFRRPQNMQSTEQLELDSRKVVSEQPRLKLQETPKLTLDQRKDLVIEIIAGKENLEQLKQIQDDHLKFLAAILTYYKENFEAQSLEIQAAVLTATIIPPSA